jgi:hypothetical protein
VNADPDPALKMNADPCGSGSRIYVKTKIWSKYIRLAGYPGNPKAGYRTWLDNHIFCEKSNKFFEIALTIIEFFKLSTKHDLVTVTKLIGV